jgi:hypothetical protein
MTGGTEFACGLKWIFAHFDPFAALSAIGHQAPVHS